MNAAPPCPNCLASLEKLVYSDVNDNYCWHHLEWDNYRWKHNGYHDCDSTTSDVREQKLQCPKCDYVLPVPPQVDELVLDPQVTEALRPLTRYYVVEITEPICDGEWVELIEFASEEERDCYLADFDKPCFWFEAPAPIPQARRYEPPERTYRVTVGFDVTVRSIFEYLDDNALQHSLMPAYEAIVKACGHENLDIDIDLKESE